MANSSATILALALVLTAAQILMCQTQSQDVYLSLNGAPFANNSYIAITSIGDWSGEALLCVTNNLHCCRRSNNLDYVAMGDWYYPNGSQVQSISNRGSDHGFFRNRGTGVVRLMYQHSAKSSPTGVFHCEIPDASGVNQTLYVHIGPVRVLSVDLNSSHSNPIEIGIIPTLTCTITVNPLVNNENLLDTPLSITWSGRVYGTGKFNITDVQKESNTTYTSIAILNSEGAYYDSGTYICTVDEVYSDTTTVLFQYPRRPTVRATSLGQTWTQLNWTQPDSDNATSFELTYSYMGPCDYTRNINRRLSASTRGYNMTSLQSYGTYSFTLTSANRSGSSPPFEGKFTTLPSVPTAAPQPILVTRFSTNITIRWERINCLRRNDEIVSYSVQYGPNINNQRKTHIVSGTNDSERMFTANRLEPLTSYSFEVAGMNRNSEIGPYSRIVLQTATPEVIPVQLQLAEVSNCLEWREKEPLVKVGDITYSVVEAVNGICPMCMLNTSDIIDPFIMCFPQSVHQVTFRAQLKDRAQATAREIVRYIEEWIKSSNVVRMTVSNVRLYINNTCAVLLSSTDDPECPNYLTAALTTPPHKTLATVQSTDHGTTSFLDSTIMMKDTPSISSTQLINDHHSTLDTNAIVGGAVAVMFIIAASVTITIIAILYRPQTKYRLDHRGPRNVQTEIKMSDMTKSDDEGQRQKEDPNEAIYEDCPTEGARRGPYTFIQCTAYGREVTNRGPPSHGAGIGVEQGRTETF